MTHGAVLVNLSIHQFGNEKMDSKIVQEVAKSHNANFSKDRYLKQLLPPAVISSIQCQVSTIRAYHYRVTSPWFDRGIRMMAAEFIMTYQKEIDVLITELYQLIGQVAKQLPQYDAEARRTRGTLFKEGDIPNEKDFRTAYKVEVELLPIGTEEDFRVEYISNKAKDKLKANNQLRFKQQTEHLVTLALDPLTRLKNSMSDLTHAPKIHKTTIESLLWWAENIDVLLVDRSLETQLANIAKRITNEVTIGYDATKKPKYDPEAIEGALWCLEEITKELQCILN